MHCTLMAFKKSEIELLYELLSWALETNKIEYFNANGADAEEILKKLKAEIKG